MTTPPNFYLYSILLGLLICLRIANYELYRRYTAGNATPDEVIDFLKRFPGAQKLLDSNLGYMLEVHLIHGIVDQQKRQEAKDIVRLRANNNPGDDALSARAKLLNEQFQWIPRTANNMTTYLVRKIEIAARFVKEEGATAD